MKAQLPTPQTLGCSVVEIHYQRQLLGKTTYIKNAHGAVEVLRKFTHSHQLDLREHFWVILLTNANCVLAISEVAIGTTRGVQTNTKYIFQLALLTNASAIIVAHNHPSGTLAFSKQDVKETKKIKELASAMEIILLDHIVITSEGFSSMANESLL